MIGTTSPETAEAERAAETSPPEDVEGGLGDVMVAVVATVLPLLFALYAVLTTGKALAGRWKFILIGGSAALYCLVLVGLGLLLARTPARALAGRTLVVCGGVLAALLAAAGWFISGVDRVPMVVLNGAGAAGLALIVATAFARVTGARRSGALILTAAVLLLGLAGGRGAVVDRAHTMVLDAAATLIACGLFVRPGPGPVPLGRLALALGVPAAALVLRPLWETTRMVELGGFVAGLLFALRVIRPRLHHGSVGLLAAGLTTVVLVTAIPSAASRQLLAAVALAGLMLLGRDARNDPDAGPVDRHLLGWLAGGVWLVLAGTWAHDLRLLDRALGLAPGFNLGSLPWVGLLALPLALPAFGLARQRLAAAPVEVEPDPDALPEGTAAEVLGWLVLAGGLAAALVPAFWTGLAPVAAVTLAVTAVIAQAWGHLRRSPGRIAVADLLVIAAVWIAARLSGRPPLALAPLVAAAVLALLPLLGRRRALGLTGALALPLLALDLVRNTTGWTAGQHLLTSGWTGPALRLPLGALAAAGAWLCVRAAGRLRREAAALEGAPDPNAPPPALNEVDPGRLPETLGWTLVAAAAVLALLPLPGADATGTVLLAALTVLVGAWARLGGSPRALAVAGVTLVLDAWLLGRWRGTGTVALAAPAVALALSLAPLLARGPEALRALGGAGSSPTGWFGAGWAGFLLFPIAVTDAVIARAAPTLPAGALLALYGLVHLIAPPQAPAWTRAAGVPALLLAAQLIATALAGTTWTSPPLAVPALVPVLAGALALLAAWAAFATAPVAIGMQALLGAIALLLFTTSPLALAPLVLLAAGRQPLLARAAAVALALAGAASLVLAPHGLAVPAAAAALIAGGAALLRPTPTFQGALVDMSALEVTLDRLRRGGPPAIAAGVLSLLFAPQAGGTGWLPALLLPAVAAALVGASAIWDRLFGRPAFLAAQTVGGGLLVATATTAMALLSDPQAGTSAPALAAGAALIALGATVVASARLSPEAATVIWGIAALAAPVAIVPLAGGPWQWPVALLAAAEVLLLAAAARRRESPILASWTLWLGLLVAIWLVVAVLARLHPAGDLLLYTGAIALGAALAGGLALAGGSAWLGAPPFFIRPFIHTCLWLGGAGAILAAAVGPLGTPLELAVTLAALLAGAGLATALALRQAAGFPWLIAGAVLVAGYAAVRLRTPWLGALGPADGLVPVGAALLATLAQRRLRADDPEPPPGVAALPAPDPRLPADDFPPLRAPGERELGWLATVLAAVSLLPVFRDDLPVHLAAIGPLLGALLLLVRARHSGPIDALVAAALFTTPIAVALVRWQIGSYAAYALPIGAAIAGLVQYYRDRLGFDAAARAVPPLATGGVCALQVFQSQTPLSAALLGGVGLLMLPVAWLWRERSYLWIGLGCLATGLVALIWLAPGGQPASGMLSQLSQLDGLRALPVLALLVAGASALLLGRSDRWVLDRPLELLHVWVRGGLLLTAALATLALLLAPAHGPIDVALALAGVAATAALALTLARRLPAGWPVLLTGAGLAGAYAYLRLRSGLLDGASPRWDGLVAVAGGFALLPIERRIRRAAAGGQPLPLPAEDDPDRWPFGVRELRLVAAGFACLSALALLQRQAPLDALAPLLAVLFFVLRTRGGHPAYGVLAVLYLNATVALFLWDRNVTGAAPYVLPVAGSLTLLLHTYREHLGTDAPVIRTLPAVAAAGACLYDAIAGPAVLTATAELAATGLVLLLLARRWQMRPYVVVGLACVGAALLTTITDWNARGWTASAIAIGTATLLVPAVLLRRR